MKLLLSLMLAAAAFAQQNTVFRRNVFDGITTAQASAALPNIGQAVHIVTLIYPAASTTVTGFTFRVEASYDNSVFFAISEDVTEAFYTGSYAYAITRCNGVYPYVRLRLVTANASNALTAHYTGSMQPIGIVKFATDRYVLQSPLAGATMEGLALNLGGEYYVHGRRITPVVPADWTSVNHNAQTIRTNGTGLIRMDVYGTAVGWQMVCKSLPASPYHIRVHFIRNSGSAAGDNPNQTGVMLRNSSTGQMIVWYWFNQNQYFIGKWASFTSESSTYLGNSGRYTHPLNSIDIVDDGVNRAFRFWDGVATYKTYNGNNETSLRTDFTTPDQVCFGASGQNGNYRTQSLFVGYDENPTW
jgi:hypothetical protein